ncbi:MAG: CoA transferase [Gammaproteobacteria bacterium]|nr:CoA transferase [Gammaproteobacteria bacterium]
MSAPTKALAGIRIIDLSMGWAGPLACRHLADMGADVIKIESCERFDWWRSWEATPEWIEDDGAEKSAAFNTMNRNKRDVTLDLEHPEGHRLLLELIGKANAVVENYSGNVLPKLNLGYDVFRKVKENIILLSMPAFGSTGPWASFRAYGSTVEQSSGLPHLNGLADDPPTMQHVALGDAVGGLTGASALLVAQRHQARTGKGQYVDLSQVEGLFPLASHGILEYAVTGLAPARRGNRSVTHAPHNVYACAGEDLWIVIEVNSEVQWEALKGVVGEPLAGFGELADGIARADALDEAIAGWTAGFDAFELMMRLQKAGVPAAATHTAAAILEDPHLEQRGFWQYLDRAVVGRQPNPSPPYRIGDAPFPVESVAPMLGQHNEEVLGGILGLGADELARLTELGVIGTRPRMPKRGNQI